MRLPRVEDDVYRWNSVTYREHSVLSCERRFSLQHLVGQTGAESAKGGVLHPPHEDEVARSKWKGDYDQI